MLEAVQRPGESEMPEVRSDPEHRFLASVRRFPIEGTALAAALVSLTPALARADCATPPPECSSASNATDCANILSKLGRNPFDAFGYVGCEPVYGNAAVHAPPCKNGAATCQPWEREWRGRPPVGSIVTDKGIVLPPQPNPGLAFLDKWQTLVAGGMAIVAAGIGAAAAYFVGRAQVRAAERRDRLQARSLSVAISPELLQLRVRHQRAVGIVNNEFPKVAGGMTVRICEVVGSARIELTPLLERHSENLFLLGDAGPTLLQLISITLQYDSLVSALVDQIRADANSFNPQKQAADLSGHLRVIGEDITEAERLLGPLHDEATRAKVAK